MGSFNENYPRRIEPRTFWIVEGFGEFEALETGESSRALNTFQYWTKLFKAHFGNSVPECHLRTGLSGLV
jgi:hypothetical protein